MDGNTQVKPLDSTNKTFLKQLAKRLVKGVNKDFSDKNLKKYFERIIQELPNGDDLKTAVLQNSTSCLKFFIRYVHKTSLKKKDTNQLPASNGVDPKNSAVAEHTKTKTTIKKDTNHVGEKEKCTQFPSQHSLGAQALFVAQQLEKSTNIEKLSEFADALMNSCASEQGVDKYCRLLQLMPGNVSITVLKKIVQMYFNELQSTTERIVANRSKDQAAECVHHLKKFLQLCHMKQPASNLGDDYPTYADLVASLISLYLDLLLIKNRNSEEEQRSVCEFVCYLMTDVGTKLLDVVLQVTAADQQNGHLLLPLLRKIFLKKPKKSSPENYLRYVLAVRMWSNLLPVLRDVKEKSRDLPAPKGFIHWLLKKSPALSEDLPTDRKFKGRLVTAFMLDDVDDNIHDRLLDVLVEVDRKKSASDTLELETSVATLEETSHSQADKEWPDLAVQISEARDQEASDEDDVAEEMVDKSERRKDARSYYSKILGGDDLFCIDRGAKSKPEVKTSMSSGENNVSREERKKIEDGEKISEVSRVPAGKENLFCIDRGTKGMLKIMPEEVKAGEDQRDNEADLLEEVQNDRDGEERLGIDLTAGDEVSYFLVSGTKTMCDTAVDLNKSTGENKKLKKEKEKKRNSKGKPVDKADLHAAADEEKLDVGMKDEPMSPENRGKLANREALSLSCTEIGTNEEVPFCVDRDTEKTCDTFVDLTKLAGKDQKTKSFQREVVDRTVLYAADNVILDVKEQEDITVPGVREENESGESMEIDTSAVPLQGSLHANDKKIMNERKTAEKKKCKSSAVGPTVDHVGALNRLHANTREKATRVGKRTRDQKPGKPNDTSESSLVSDTCKLEGVSSDMTTENKVEDGSDAEVSASSPQQQSGLVPFDTKMNQVPASSDIVAENKCLKKSPQKVNKVSSPAVLNSEPQQESNDVELDKEVDVRLSPRKHQKQNLRRSMPEKALQSPGTFENSKAVENETRPSSLGKSASRLLLSDKKGRNFLSKDSECKKTSPAQMQHRQPETSCQMDAGFKITSIADHSQVSASTEDASSLVFLTPSLKKFSSPGIARTVGSGRRDSCGDSKKTPNSKPKSITPVSRRTRGQRKKLEGETPSTTNQTRDVANVRMWSAQLEEKSVTNSTSKKLSGRLGTEESAKTKRKVPLRRLPENDSACDSVGETMPQSKKQSKAGADDFTKVRARNKDMAGSLEGSFIQEPLSITPPKKAKLLNEDSAVKKSARKRKEPSRSQTSLLDSSPVEKSSSSPVKSHRKARNENTSTEQKRHIGSGNTELSPGKHSPAKLSPEKLAHTILTRSKVKGYNLRVHPK